MPRHKKNPFEREKTFCDDRKLMISRSNSEYFEQTIQMSTFNKVRLTGPYPFHLTFLLATTISTTLRTLITGD